jgi:hypothetical protein
LPPIEPVIAHFAVDHVVRHVAARRSHRRPLPRERMIGLPTPRHLVMPLPRRRQGRDRLPRQSRRLCCAVRTGASVD